MRLPTLRMGNSGCESGFGVGGLAASCHQGAASASSTVVFTDCPLLFLLTLSVSLNFKSSETNVFDDCCSRGSAPSAAVDTQTLTSRGLHSFRSRRVYKLLLPLGAADCSRRDSGQTRHTHPYSPSLLLGRDRRSQPANQPTREAGAAQSPTKSKSAWEPFTQRIQVGACGLKGRRSPLRLRTRTR